MDFRIISKNQLDRILLKEGHKLKKDVTLSISLSGVNIYTLELLVGQRRIIDGKYQLLYDTIRWEANDFIRHYPYLVETKEDFEYAAKVLENEFYNGKISRPVIPFLRLIPKIHSIHDEHTQIIRIAEYTENELQNWEQFSNERIVDDVEEELEMEYHVLKDNGQYVLSSLTGEKIFRFSYLRLVGDGFEDRIVSSKIFPNMNQNF